jgi:hypothetical protein
MEIKSTFKIFVFHITVHSIDKSGFTLVSADKAAAIGVPGAVVDPSARYIVRQYHVDEFDLPWRGATETTATWSALNAFSNIFNSVYGSRREVVGVSHTVEEVE